MRHLAALSHVSEMRWGCAQNCPLHYSERQAASLSSHCCHSRAVWNPCPQCPLEARQTNRKTLPKAHVIEHPSLFLPDSQCGQNPLLKRAASLKRRGAALLFLLQLKHCPKKDRAMEDGPVRWALVASSRFPTERGTVSETAHKLTICPSILPALTETTQINE